MATEFVTITMDEYNELVERSDFLGCLEACGVDNWSGYDDAVEMFEEEVEVEDIKEIHISGIVSGVPTSGIYHVESETYIKNELYEDEEDEWY